MFLIQIDSLFKYEPYRQHGQDNPNRNHITRHMMNLKDPRDRGHEEAIRFFQPELEKRIQKIAQELGVNCIQVAIIPSSVQGITSSGLEALVKGVQYPRIIYNNHYLYRHTNVDSAKNGGARNREKHLNSISSYGNIDVNIPVLIIDDVTTTGCSMMAGYTILKKAGVRIVRMLAIGKTVST